MLKSFNKAQRLLTSDQFQALRGTSLTVSNKYILLLARKNDVNIARIGLTISKRNVKLAVQRNVIKRIARESFRHLMAQLPHIDLVLMARPSAITLTKKELRECIDTLLLQLAKRAK